MHAVGLHHRQAQRRLPRNALVLVGQHVGAVRQPRHHLLRLCEERLDGAHGAIGDIHGSVVLQVFAVLVVDEPVTLLEAALHLLTRAHGGHAVHTRHDRLLDQLAINLLANGLEEAQLLHALGALGLAIREGLFELADVFVHQIREDTRHISVHVAGPLRINEVHGGRAVAVQGQRGVMLQAVAAPVHLYGQERYEVVWRVARPYPLVQVAQLHTRREHLHGLLLLEPPALPVDGVVGRVEYLLDHLIRERRAILKRAFVVATEVGHVDAQPLLVARAQPLAVSKAEKPAHVIGAHVVEDAVNRVHASSEVERVRVVDGIISGILARNIEGLLDHLGLGVKMHISQALPSALEHDPLALVLHFPVPFGARHSRRRQHAYFVALPRRHAQLFEHVAAPVGMQLLHHAQDALLHAPPRAADAVDGVVYSPH
mmetsp:Transcript_9614/g.39531  ORF Transcript_9614/g.39531 Transcript_9614/m.39531 type:complete len:429 (+) Transcript_9614:438-1724(+)